MSYFDDVFEPMLTRVPKHAYHNTHLEQERQIALIDRGIWPSKHGLIPMCDMSDGHIRNCINLINRRRETVDDRGAVDVHAMKALEDELERRESRRSR